jgi:hypothetical protein
MDMKSMIALILLTTLVVLSSGSALAEDAGNATTALNATNDTAVAEAATVAASLPQADASRFEQLSTFVKGTATVLGKNQAQGYTDVSQSANPKEVFTRGAGELSPSTKLGITKVGTGDDRYVEVASKAVGEWNLTGWSLSSADNTTFAFPAITLEEGAVVRVHEGQGTGSATDIYTNSNAPLWTDNLVSLVDAEGDVISTFDVSNQPVTKWVDPLANQIQY